MSTAVSVELDAPLPWLSEDWSRLQGARAAGRLAHGLMISGPRGVGKRHLAELLARALLCHAPDAQGLACGRCADCRLLRAESHPDLLRVGPDPESKSGEITIATVRALVERGALTPSRGARKVTLIDPADHLNSSAANALLKTLEEPPGDALLCLITEQPGRLPATIRSRCQQIRIPIPSAGQSLHWLSTRVPATDLALRLRLAHGAPLQVLSELETSLLAQRHERLTGFLAIARGERDPIAEAAVWNEVGAERMLDWLATWLVDLLRLSVSEDPAWLENPDQRATLGPVARRLDQAATHRLLRRVLWFRGLVEARLNPQLMLESVSIQWLRVSTQSLSRRD
jgi:DNA polymerase-3 subunit delta'